MDEALPATCLSLLRQFDATDANGSLGRRRIKCAWLVMNSKGTCSSNVVSQRSRVVEGLICIDQQWMIWYTNRIFFFQCGWIKLKAWLTSVSGQKPREEPAPKEITFAPTRGLTKQHIYLKRAKRGNPKLEFLAPQISGAPYRREKVHSSTSWLNGIYLMREKQIPIKLFHKALAQWVQERNPDTWLACNDQTTACWKKHERCHLNMLTKLYNSYHLLVATLE